ncbi:GNAT family N-acetyltransferase [Nonomuraea sp. NPDC002799]
MRRVVCEGERLGLRDVTEADVAALLAIYGDPTVTQHVPFAPRSREEVAGLVGSSRC